VDDYLHRMHELVTQLIESETLDPAEAIVTAGGSLFFDRVVAQLLPVCSESGLRLVLRSGCYLIHDHGLYADGTPSSNAVPDAPVFRPALSVWARVVSVPEGGLALLDAGRRDLSHDAGLPVPLQRHRNADVIDLAAAGARVSALSDQHTFVQYPAGLDLIEGDLVRLGISHPCTTLDRWRSLLLVDDDNHVTGAVSTAF
jgi:D-serine dehydratase